MDEKIDFSIKVLLDKIRPTVKFDEALKFTQAALNLAHVRQIYLVVEAEKKKAG